MRYSEQSGMSSVAGYLLLEFHAQSNFFGDRACVSIVTRVTSLPRDTSGDEHSVVFEAGRLFLCCFTLTAVLKFEHRDALPRTSHPSRPSIDTPEDMTKGSIEATQGLQDL